MTRVFSKTDRFSKPFFTFCRIRKNGVKKKELKDLSRKELVDLVYDMVEEEEYGQFFPSENEVKSERKRLQHKALFWKTLMSTISTLVVVAAVAVLLSVLFFPVIQVSGDSMEPTMSDGDILVLRKSGQFERGQLCCISWQNKLLIKRVIGIPGDYIFIDEDGNVYVNNAMIEEPYIAEKSLGYCDVEFPMQVPEGKYFVLGDRRETSSDSRNSAIGCIDKEQILGRVWTRIWHNPKRNTE